MIITDAKKQLITHDPEQCKGQYCCIHNPSDHHMKDWPLNWRTDRGIMERICPHGVGIPDPDDVAHHMRMHPEDKYYAVHGSCGICFPVVEQQSNDVEEKQQTRIPLKDKTAGAAPVNVAQKLIIEADRLLQKAKKLSLKKPRALESIHDAQVQLDDALEHLK